jgi:hypothetical protein
MSRNQLKDLAEDLFYGVLTLITYASIGILLAWRG